MAVADGVESHAPNVTLPHKRFLKGEFMKKLLLILLTLTVSAVCLASCTQTIDEPKDSQTQHSEPHEVGSEFIW